MIKRIEKKTSIKYSAMKPNKRLQIFKHSFRIYNINWERDSWIEFSPDPIEKPSAVWQECAQLNGISLLLIANRFFDSYRIDSNTRKVKLAPEWLSRDVWYSRTKKNWTRSLFVLCWDYFVALAHSNASATFQLYLQNVVHNILFVSMH